MGTSRRLAITAATTLAVLAIVAGALLSTETTTSSRALDADSSVVAPIESPSTTVALAAPEAPDEPVARPAVNAPAVAPVAPAPPAPAAPVDEVPAAAEPPAEVPISRNPVPLPDRTGPAITNLDFTGCVIVANVTDPAGVANVTVTWSAVPDPQLPGQWIREAATVPMHRLDGDRFQTGRGHSYRGQVFTVTAVDRTLVGNRSSASIIFDWPIEPC